MRIRHKSHPGFTTIELVVTLVVGAAIVIGLSQIYGIIIDDSSAVRNRANASNIAYTEARKVAAESPIPSGSGCPTQVTTPTARTLPSAPVLPGPVSMRYTKITPYAGYSPANCKTLLITVTVTYGNPAQSVKHAFYKYE